MFPTDNFNKCSSNNSKFFCSIFCFCKVFCGLFKKWKVSTKSKAFWSKRYLNWSNNTAQKFFNTWLWLNLLLFLTLFLIIRFLLLLSSPFLLTWLIHNHQQVLLHSLPELTEKRLVNQILIAPKMCSLFIV